MLEVGHDGTVTVANHVELGDMGRITLDGGTLQVNTLTSTGDAALEFNAGTLDADGDVSLSGPLIVGAGGTLNVATRLDARLTSLPGSTINIDGGPAEVNIGESSNFLGVDLQGILSVGDKSVRLNSAGFAQLGTYTIVNGGAIAADNGMALGTGDNLAMGSGGGTFDSKIVAAVGSLIRAQGSVVMGDALALDGFVNDGVLDVFTANMTILDANQAVLGSLTELGVVIPPLMFFMPGTLTADNGLILEFGRNISGYGTVATANDPLRPTIINGHAQGYDGTYQLTFTGYVKGVGTMNDVVISGTYAPGLSTAVVNVGDLAFADTGTLEIEIDGPTAGSEFDVVSSTGNIEFDGTLAVLLGAGFVPTSGDGFTVVEYVSHSGEFDDVTGVSLGDGRALIPIYGATELSLVASYHGDGNLDGVVDGLDYLLWAANFGEDPADNPPGSPKNGDFNADGLVDGLDYLAWAGNFGASVTASAVPEPGGLVLLGIGTTLLGGRRRRSSAVSRCTTTS